MFLFASLYVERWALLLSGLQTGIWRSFVQFSAFVWDVWTSFRGHQGATESKRDRRRGPGWNRKVQTIWEFGCHIHSPTKGILILIDIVSEYQYPKRMDDCRLNKNMVWKNVLFHAVSICDEDVYGVRLSPLQYEIEWKMRTAKSTFLGWDLLSRSSGRVICIHIACTAAASPTQNSIYFFAMPLLYLQYIWFYHYLKNCRVYVFFFQRRNC